MTDKDTMTSSDFFRGIRIGAIITAIVILGLTWTYSCGFDKAMSAYEEALEDKFD